MGSSSWAEDPWVGERYEDYAVEPDRWSTGYRSPRERTVSYVVLVDGRVVDTWYEPLTESPWLGDPRVEKVERLWRHEPPPRKEVAPWRATVDWLEHVVGGPEALDQLTADLLPDEELILPAEAAGDGEVVARFRRAGEVLDGLAGVYFDRETRTAFRRALTVVGMELMGGRVPEDPVQVAAGVCWAVGRANGVLAPAGRVTQKVLCAQLGLASFPAAKGRTVARLLATPKPPWVSRPGTLPDLEPLSRTDLLTSRTRREIIALRDATVAAEARAAARDRARIPEQLIDETDGL